MRPTPSLLAAGLALVLALACRPAAPRSPGGTAWMADTLRVIAERSLANPLRNPFLNRARADTLAARLGPAPSLADRYALAQERLVAGQHAEAIELLRTLAEEIGLRPESIPEEGKPILDLLAISYLRQGEEENCVDNPGAGVCILPLDKGGQHRKEEGARQAIRVLEAVLGQYPGDHGSRWLLNIAYMALGGYPGQVPPRFLVPGLSPPQGSDFPRFPNVAGDTRLGISSRAGGLSVEDFNGDGHLDLFMTSWGLSDPVRLFLADGRGGYAEATADAGLSGIVGGLNTVHADYDNDGDADILVLRGAWMGEAGNHPNSLLRNDGTGRFEDVTAAAGVLSFHPTQAAGWADFDLDGYLDLFIGNESTAAEGRFSHPSELYRNNGDGTFSEVSRQVGLVLDAFVKGVAWGDVNNDGLPDLFASVLAGPNRLFLNRGGRDLSSWRFEERGAAAGVEAPAFSFPAWFWDYDQDGWEDLLVLSYDTRDQGALQGAVAREYLGLPATITHDGQPVEVERSRLYRNNGDGTFADRTRPAGLWDKVIFAMGSNFGDLDNDGWLDFYLGTGNPDLRAVIPNRMFRSVDGRRFEEVTLAGGFGHIQKGHAVAFADLDRDGDEDVYAVMGGAYEGDHFGNVLFENPGWPGRAWIGLHLEGRQANRSAIGARVELVVRTAAGTLRTLYRTIGTGGSFGATTLGLHVGLGDATGVERVTIRWPDAARSATVLDGLEPNRSYRVIQGEDAVALDRAPVPFRRLPAAPGDTTHRH